MRDKIRFHKSRRRIVPVRKCAYGDRATDRRDGAGSPTPWAALLALWPQRSINRGRAHPQKRHTQLGGERQVAVALHRLDQCRNDRLQALATYPVRRFPKHDQRLALGFSVDAP